MDGLDGKDGRDGVDGRAAYDMAVERGFVGSPDDWLKSLAGKDGAQGLKGDKGDPGRDGKDGRDGVNGKNGRNGKDAPLPTSVPWEALFKRAADGRTERVSMLEQGALRWVITPAYDEQQLITRATLIPL
jgi:hypothetical protein